jgi:predicted ATP-grasp superfamily ATP-dependent carboligase
VSPTLLIFGASTRAAAFSALRAGLSPWCADLFADADLRARCPVQTIPLDRYPEGFADLAAPEAPWIYTGGLENHPRLVGRLSRARPLWGNDASALRKVRSPEALARLFRSAGIPYPDTRTRPPNTADGPRWLSKPVAGAGGSDIRFWTNPSLLQKKRVYYQQYVEGEPCSAVYVSGPEGTRPWGVSTQLIGEPWLHAKAFQYCGSICGTPLPDNLTQLGTALAEGAGLRGLFGVDFVLRDGVAWPVEVNPRYTASVEVHELARGVSLLAEHRRVFDPFLSPRLAASFGERGSPRSPKLAAKQNRTVGKAVYFARETVTFPTDGPWRQTLRDPPSLWDIPPFADMPHPGERIDAGRPVLTFFTAANSQSACRAALRETARELDRRLYAR